MAMACAICDEFRGHNQETHNDHYEKMISALWEEIGRLKEKIASK